MSYRKELDKLKNGFFSNIKHEFRTPINMILTSIQLIEKKWENHLFGNCKLHLKTDIERIYTNTLRILKVSNNFIDLTSIKSGTINYNPQNYNIVDVIESICMDINNYRKFRNISIIFDTEVEEKIVSFDKESLERIMINLMLKMVR